MSWIYLGTFKLPRIPRQTVDSKYTIEAYQGVGSDDGYFQFYFPGFLADNYSQKYFISKSLCPFKVISDAGFELYPTYDYSEFGDQMIWKSSQNYYLYGDVFIKNSEQISFTPWTYQYIDSSNNTAYGGKACWSGRLLDLNKPSVFTAQGQATGEADITFTLVFQEETYVCATKFGIYTNVYNNTTKIFGSPQWHSKYGYFTKQVLEKINEKPVFKGTKYSITWDGECWLLFEKNSPTGWYQLETDPIIGQNFTMKFKKPEGSEIEGYDLDFTFINNLVNTDETVKGFLGDLPIWI